jgi:hypothetical protein
MEMLGKRQANKEANMRYVPSKIARRKSLPRYMNDKMPKAAIPRPQIKETHLQCWSILLKQLKTESPVDSCCGGAAAPGGAAAGLAEPGTC